MAKQEIEDEIKKRVDEWNRQHPEPEPDTIEYLFKHNPEIIKLFRDKN